MLIEFSSDFERGDIKIEEGLAGNFVVITQTDSTNKKNVVMVKYGELKELIEALVALHNYNDTGSVFRVGGKKKNDADNTEENIVGVEF